MNLSEASLQEALSAFRADLFSALRAVMPGVLLAYDAETGLASVQPGLSQRLSSGEILPAPILSGVPVFLPSKDAAVTPGSPCLLLLCDFCLDGWLESRQPVVPPFPRRHDLSDAIALPGFFPCVSSLSA